MRRRFAVRKRDIHREEQRRAKGAKPHMVLPTDTVDENNQIVVGGVEKKLEPKKAPAKKKPAAKKKSAPKKAAKKNA